MESDVPVLKADPFESRWLNWIRWCNQKGLYQGRTGSLEGAYRSPQIWHPPEPRPPTIDVPDAILVNKAYTRLAKLSPTNAQVIKTLVFMPWLKPTRQAQILGTHYMRLDELLHRAKTMLKNQLLAS